jgi:hypothetical protein
MSPQHYSLCSHKVNLQSIVASIVLLFSLSFYLNIESVIHHVVVPLQQPEDGEEAIITSEPSSTFSNMGEVDGRGGQRSINNGKPTLVLHMGPTKTGSKSK